MAAVVDVSVLIVSTLCAPEEGDDVLLQRLRQLVDATPGVTLGLYECPAPYHRLLTLEALAYAATSGRFVFLKDTCRDNAVIDARLAHLAKLPASPFRWYNGNVTTLLHSLRAGAFGIIAACARTFRPASHSPSFSRRIWLWRRVGQFLSLHSRLAHCQL